MRDVDVTVTIVMNYVDPTLVESAEEALIHWTDQLTGERIHVVVTLIPLASVVVTQPWNVRRWVAPAGQEMVAMINPLLMAFASEAMVALEDVNAFLI